MARKKARKKGRKKAGKKTGKKADFRMVPLPVASIKRYKSGKPIVKGEHY